jgi:hypothetical protein
LTQDDDDEDAAAAVAFYPGQFMGAVFECVRGLLSQSFEFNLRLTALIAKLAAAPQALLDTYLLNPNAAAFAPGTRLLLRELSQVWQSALTRRASVADYSTKLAEVKQQLSGGSSSSAITIDAEERTLMQSVLLLEEWVLELVAISSVKHNLGLS